MVEGGGSVIAAFFLAHNYVSEQFGNYVEYGMCLLFLFITNLLFFDILILYRFFVMRKRHVHH